MSHTIEINQIDIKIDALKNLNARQRNQLIGCMHSHNELSVFNRLLLFSLNDVGEGDLINKAHGVQMWCILQVLVGKIYETWAMIEERFLKMQPEDPILAKICLDGKDSLAWLKSSFSQQRKHNPLRIIRDKSAFHYDKLNLDKSIENFEASESSVYLAKHPTNTVYYAGSALVFHSLFERISGYEAKHDEVSYIGLVNDGVQMTLKEVCIINDHLHTLLYSIISLMLSDLHGRSYKGCDILRHSINDAPMPIAVNLPMFLNMTKKV